MTISTCLKTICASLFATSICLGEVIDVPLGGDLQAALDGAPIDATIQLSEGTYEVAFTALLGGRAMTIRGAGLDDAGRPLTKISGGGSCRVFLCSGNEEGDLRLEQLEIREGFDASGNKEGGTSADGGGIYVFQADPSFDECWFVGNRGSRGGGVYADASSSPTFTNCTFLQNVGERSSAAICWGEEDSSAGSTMVVRGCTFTSNVDEGAFPFTFGEGIVTAQGGDLVLEESEFMMNDGFTSVGLAGTPAAHLVDACVFDDRTLRTIDWTGGTLSLRNTTLRRTDQSEASYGLYSSELEDGPGSLLLENCIFDGFRGSALLIKSSNQNGTIRNVDITDSGADFNAAVVISEAGRLEFIDCRFSDNVLAGAVVATNVGFTSCEFNGNEFQFGSAFSGHTADFEQCEFIANRTGLGGGTVFVQGGPATFSDCEFRGNASDAPGGGLGVRFNEAMVLVERCAFFDNTAAYGGGLAIGDSNVEILDCEFRGNQAVGFKKTFAALGGAIYVENVGATVIDILDCNIIENISDDAGGGIHVDSSRPGSTGPRVGGTTVCQNLPDQVTGPFDDLGGNTISELGSCNLAPYDFDGNWTVDGGDLAIVLGSWGPCTDDPCQADLNGDDRVDGGDLALVLGNWGPVDP